jgi:hypothetical protein
MNGTTGEPDVLADLPKRGPGPLKAALYVRIDPEVRAWLDAFTAEQRSTLGDVVTLALRQLRNRVGEGPE